MYADHDDHTEVNSSIATCEVVAIGYSEVANTQAIAEVSALLPPSPFCTYPKKCLHE